MSRLAERLDDRFDSGSLSKGTAVELLADAISKRTGYENVIMTANGTGAIFLLAAWFKSKGATTLRCPAFTWPSTYLPFRWLGFELRMADIDESTWTASFGLDDVSSQEVKGAVDTFGAVSWPPGEDRLAWIDSAQSFGSPWATQHTRIISLSPTKVATTGEGGALLTNDDDLADFARKNAAWMSRMPEASASIGLATMEVLDDTLRRKAEIAAMYHEAFERNGWPYQKTPLGTNHNIVAALIEDRDVFLKRHPDVEFKHYYTGAWDPAIGAPTFPFSALGLSVSQYVSERIVCFPSHLGVTEEMIDRLTKE